MIEGIPGWVEWIVGSSAGVVGAGVLWKAAKAAVKKLWAFNEWLVQFAKDVQAFSEVAPDLVSIAHEVKPNGGTNLRGAIDRIEKKAHEAEQMANEVKEMTVEQTRILTEIRAKCESHCPLEGSPKVIT